MMGGEDGDDDDEEEEEEEDDDDEEEEEEESEEGYSDMDDSGRKSKKTGAFWEILKRHLYVSFVCVRAT